MKTTRNPSTHAAAWKARALAALRSDSSLSVRLRRYNEAMAKARALEAEASQQQVTRMSGHRDALAVIVGGEA